MTTFDVRWACDVLRPVYDATGGVDGRVSIEVDPRLAYDTEATTAEARFLWWLVDRPNLFVKIPAARQGLPGHRGVPGRGDQHQRHADLLPGPLRGGDGRLPGRPGARPAGRHDLSSIASVASFFVSRVDTEVDARLDKIGTAEAAALRGRAAIANARLAYQHYERMLSSPRWAALAAAGARPQRPLWASTSVKDPAYPDTRYVTGLVAPDVVNTMPEATLRAVADHGEIPDDSVRGHYAEARAVLSHLEAIGVDYGDVTEGLESNGLAAFDASWRELGDQIAAQLRHPSEDSRKETRAMGAAHVIVGASLAGAKAAETLREEGFGGPIVLIGEEDERPYERPSLSKDYLLGKAERETIYVHPQAWYADHGVDLRLGTLVTGVDPLAHEVTLADGSRIGYGKLLLATGSAPRRLPVPGADAEGVLYLRRVGRQRPDPGGPADRHADRGHRRGLDRPGDRRRGPGGRRRGDGPGGGRAAAAARTRPGGRRGLRRCTASTASTCASVSRSPRSPAAGGRPTAFGWPTAVTSRPTRSSSASGSPPTASSPRRQAWTVDNGIVVDAGLRSSDPDIYAAGDVANAYHPVLGRYIRVEHWANALNQPQAAARAMLGQDVAYDLVPYFYTDQYDLGMEYAGYVEPGAYDRVVFRGDVEGREFVAFWLRGGRVLAGMNVNIWDVNEVIQAIVRGGRTVDAAGSPTSVSPSMSSPSGTGSWCNAGHLAWAARSSVARSISSSVL